MGNIELGCGSHQKRVHFYVHSPMKRPSQVPDGGVEFSRETPTHDWALFTHEGFGMISRLLPFMRRGDYIRVYRWYVEITFMNGERWLRVFPDICVIMNEWQGGGRLHLDVAQDCSALKRPWIERLIRLVVES